MEILITHVISETSVSLVNSTIYPNPPFRGDMASLMYVTNKRTTGDAPIIVNQGNPLTTNEYVLANLADGYYKPELLAVPDFVNYLRNVSEEQAYTVLAGTITHHNSLFYRAVQNIPNVWDLPTPDLDYNNWEVVDISKIENVYKEAFQATLPPHAQTSYGFIEFVFYNNLVYAFLELSANVTQSSNICANPQIEALRCLRDKYESVELAVAAGNYSGAQMIIESSQNLVNSCSC